MQESEEELGRGLEYEQWEPVQDQGAGLQRSPLAEQTGPLSQGRRPEEGLGPAVAVMAEELLLAGKQEREKIQEQEHLEWVS